MELRERVQEFSRREIPEDVAARTDKENEFPSDMWKKLGDAGYDHRVQNMDRRELFMGRLWLIMGVVFRLLGITADEDYGGLAMGYQAHCIVMEEISKASGQSFYPTVLPF